MSFPRRILALLAHGALAVVALAASPASDSPSQLVKLVDYIGSDYSAAVSKGEIISPSEYEEIVRFHGIAAEKLTLLLAEANDDGSHLLREQMNLLGAALVTKADPPIVAGHCRALRENLIARFRIPSAPKSPPSLERGRDLFAANCAVCHGATGDGKNSIQPPHDPPPRNFHDEERMSGLSPFQAFNAITYGVENTAMAGHSLFSDEERWDLAYYVFTLRHADSATPSTEEVDESFATLADASDGELLGRLREQSDEQAARAALARLRRVSAYREASVENPLRYAGSKLRSASAALRAGKRRESEDAVVAAYLDGVEKVEMRLRAQNPALATSLEKQFFDLRGALASKKSAEEIFPDIQSLRGDLLRAESSLEDRPRSFSESFGLSLLIVTREGAEAALVVAAILGLLRLSGNRSAQRATHAGWISAILAGLGMWLLSETLIHTSGAGRELVEGLASLLGAIVLFFVSHWMLSRADARRWNQFIQGQVRDSIASGRAWALFGVSFLAVFRESAETVLFYQALVKGSPDSGFPIFTGFLAGSVLLVLLILAILKLGMRLPLRYFYLGSGWLLYLLAFIFAGQGVWALQEGAHLRITPLEIPQISWLGIHPSLEGAIAQSAFLLALVGGWIWSRRRQQAGASASLRS